MASRASSETPRVPPLPRLGTSWYVRGGGYWARRVSYVIALTVIMAGVCGMAVAMYRGFEDAAVPAGGRTACDVIEAVLAVAGAAWGWVAGRRKIRAECAKAQGEKASWAAYRDRQRRAPGLASAGRLLVVLAAPVLPAAMVGVTAYLLATLLVAETPAEIGARRELAAKGLPERPARA